MNGTSMAKRTILVELTVTDVENQPFITSLTHPDLEGQLVLRHGSSDRLKEAALNQITFGGRILDGVREVEGMFGKISDALTK